MQNVENAWQLLECISYQTKFNNAQLLEVHQAFGGETGMPNMRTNDRQNKSAGGQRQVYQKKETYDSTNKPKVARQGKPVEEWCRSCASKFHEAKDCQLKQHPNANRDWSVKWKDSKMGSLQIETNVASYDQNGNYWLNPRKTAQLKADGSKEVFDTSADVHDKIKKDVQWNTKRSAVSFDSQKGGGFKKQKHESKYTPTLQTIAETPNLFSIDESMKITNASASNPDPIP